MPEATGVAVVSGAGSGIGRAAALALARRGHPLALVGRRREPLEAVLDECEGRGVVFDRDVTAPNALEGLARLIESEQGPVDVVLPAAGIARVEPFAEAPPEAFATTVETNLIGAARLYREFLPAMKDRGRGVLVALLSVAARRSFPGWSAYCASKWGLLGLVEALREELSGSGVRMLAVTPGATDTELWRDLPGEWERSRMLPVDEVVRALLWGLDASAGAAIEEIRIQPPGGNL